jgi:hypothetical protein
MRISEFDLKNTRTDAPKERAPATSLGVEQLQGLGSLIPLQKQTRECLPRQQAGPYDLAQGRLPLR